jgi:hypothetical protein
MRAETREGADGPGPREGEEDAARAGRGWWWVAGAVVVAGGLLRALAARGELFVDEITSLAMAKGATASAVFTSIRSYGNHHLMTLWLLVAGPSAEPIVVRLPAVLAGMATLLLVAARWLPFRRLETLVWLVWLSVSWILVHYGSEARGYSLAVCLAVGAFAALDRYLATRRRSWAALFALATSLGLLSQLTFLFVLAPLAAWAATDALLRRDARRLDPALLAAFAAPAATLATLWVMNLREGYISGGPDWQPWSLVREFFRATLGLPKGPLELLGILAVGSVGWEVVLRARERRADAAFFGTLFLAPVVVVAWVRPSYLAPRYFIVVVPFFLLLLACSVARLARRYAWGRIAAAAAVLVVATGSLAFDARLVRYGRGAYRDAMRYLLRESPPGEVQVASDSDFRDLVLLSFYAPGLPGGDRFAYLPRLAWSGDAPLWLLHEEFDEDAPPIRDRVGPGGRRYVLAEEFPFAGLSGWSWHVYRRDDGR